MQAVDSNILIKKVDEYIKNNSALLELEITELDLETKMNLTYYEFFLPLELLKQCSVIQKKYFEFSILVVKDWKDKTLGIRITTRNNQFYQLSSYEKREKDGSLNHVVNYMMEDADYHAIVTIQKNQKGNENVFSVTSNDYENNPNLAENIVMKIQKEVIKQLNIQEIGNNLFCNDASTKVNKKIEKESDCNGAKIYQIRRRGF